MASQPEDNKSGNAGIFALSLQEVTKPLPGGRVLFKDLSLSFFHGAKIGVLGQNGSGKSSLLKIMAGVDKDFDGVCMPYKEFKVGYLAQEPLLDPALDVTGNVRKGLADKQAILTEYENISQEFADPDANFDELLERQEKCQATIERLELWDLDHRIQIAMDALRCPPGDWGVTTLSGGERRRVALCALLLSEPDILLLDEPTNHLDAESVAWLEHFLSTYKGLVVAITHDRYFLDNVAGYILELDGGQCYPFKGNYVQWLENKGKRMALMSKREETAEKLYARELEWIRKGAKGGRKKGKAREKNFKDMAEVRAAKRSSKKVESGGFIVPQGPRLGNDVVTLTNVGCVLDGQQLFSDLNLKLTDGQMLGIIGPNGSGKTTLLRMLTGELKPASGTVHIGDSVRFGYNAQHRDALDANKQLWQEILGGDEVIEIEPGHTIAGRKYVAQFNFSGTLQQKTVGQLSGGERNRVHLAKSLKHGCNVIILDEPTNDLDVDTLRKLEECLMEFHGSGIIVSHDRYFLDRVATDILAFNEDGSFDLFKGNYSDYEAERKRGRDQSWTPKPFKKIAR